MAVVVTSALAREVADVIERHFVGLAATLYGKDSVTAAEWQMAIDMGLVDPAAPPEAITQQMHVFGSFLAHLKQSDVQDRYGTSASDFLKEIRRNPVPMTTAEAHSAAHANHNAAQYVVGLGNKLGATLGSTLIEADADLDRDLRGVIRDVISSRYGDNDAANRLKDRGVDMGLGDEFFDNTFRASMSRMESDMRQATQDWGRDYRRIVQTESQRATNAGQRAAWEEMDQEAAKLLKRPVARIIAYKVPRPDACSKCRTLHLDGGHPRLFYLDTLAGNGTNVRLKRADWNVVEGPTHPYCHCTFMRTPAGLSLPTGWKEGNAAPSVIDADGMLVLPEDDE